MPCRNPQYTRQTDRAKMPQGFTLCSIRPKLLQPRVQGITQGTEPVTEQYQKCRPGKAVRALLCTKAKWQPGLAHASPMPTLPLHTSTRPSPPSSLRLISHTLRHVTDASDDTHALPAAAAAHDKNAAAARSRTPHPASQSHHTNSASDAGQTWVELPGIRMAL
jgi:hypothetical protein